MSEQKQGSNDGAHPGMSMPSYEQQVGMGQVTQVTMGHGTQVTMSQVAISQAGGMMTHAQGLPTLAPAPSSASGQPMQPGAPMHGMTVGQPGAPQGMPGQMIPQPMGQFQVIQQPQFGNGQYATMPQFASYNQQGQLVLTPAPQFTIPGMPGQQPGQQQIILTGVPQKAGQPHMLASQPPGGGKTPTGQPCYTITSSGQLQMSGGQPGQQPQPTFMLANPMAPGMPGQVSAGGSQQGQIIHTSMAGKDTKNLSGPGQVPGQQPPGNQQMVLQNMAYMPTQPHGNAIFQNGQILFRAPGGPQDQQFMFSPNGQPTTPPQAPVPHPSSMTPSNGPMSQMSMPVSSIRPPSSISSGPPGKIAVSRALAPLLPTGSQTGPRSSYMPQNFPRQPSPKSKQKMSPPWRPGRPPAPNTAKFQPKLAGIQSTMPRSPGSPMHPGSPMNMNPGSPMNTSTSSPRPPLHTSSPGPTSLATAIAGPPTLTPMMMPTVPLARTATPPGIPISMPTIPVLSTPISTVIPSYVPSSIPSQINQLPPLNLPSLPPIPPFSNAQPLPISTISPLGPPTLTKEVSSPMPNLGPPNFPPASQPKPLPSQVTAPPTSTDSSDPGLVPAPKAGDPSLVLAPKPTEPGLIPSTPKAVVKPQVLTHVIDGHIIKESSQPFPISSKSDPPKGRRKSDQKEVTPPAPNGTVPTSLTTNGTNGTNGTVVPTVNGTNGNANNGSAKRGPGRPPGSTKNILDQQKVDSKGKPVGGEPPEKKQKSEKDIVAPLTNANDREEVTTPVVKDNPLKWNVLQVCDFIKNLPGCSDYAEDFALQEIDGQALMLLKADHLMSAMAIKLGPALKICSQISLMREELHLN